MHRRSCATRRLLPDLRMALERMSAEAGDAANPELADMTRRFWIAGVLSVPLLAMAMGDDLAKPMLDALIAPHVAVWVQLILGTPAVLWCGWPFFVRGWESVVNRSLNMFTLIALGTGVAYLYSLVAALVPGLFPASFRGMEGEVPLYFEAAAVITALVLRPGARIAGALADQQCDPRPRSRAEAGASSRMTAPKRHRA